MIHLLNIVYGRKEPYVVDKNGVYNFYRYKEVSNIVKNPNFSREIAERKNDVFYSFLDSDPPYHTRLRKIISPYFKQKFIDEIKHKIQILVDNRVKLFNKNSHIDLIDDYGYTMPFEMISIILGIPEIGQRPLREMAQNITNALDLDYGVTLSELKKHRESMTALTIFMADVLEYKKHNKDDDIISFLLSDSQLSKGEIMTFCMLLYIAGFETTANMIGNALHAILSNEDIKAQIAKNGLSANAIDELLRYNTSIHRVLRKVKEDTVLNLEDNILELKSGTKVFAYIGSANRDERVFESPDEVILDRPNANKNLSFSLGPHYCVGSFLAKEEIKISVETIIKSFPGIELTENIEWKSSKTFRGLNKMIVKLQ